MNEREALEKIANFLKDECKKSYDCPDFMNWANQQQHSCKNKCVQKILQIATQALAPQEQWEVTIKCPECGTYQRAIVKNAIPFPIYAHICKKCGYTITESEWEEITPQECDVIPKCDIRKLFGCDYPHKENCPSSCVNKQLHSQQKTFTVEEVREIIFDLKWIKLQKNNNFYKLVYPNHRPTLLSEEGNLINIIKQKLFEKERILKGYEELTDVMKEATNDYLIRLNDLINKMWLEFEKEVE